MSDKKAFVFDTNFIIQVKDLNEVINNLKDEFTVYVTQVSIDERIGQQCRDLRKKYDEIPKIQEEYKGILTISIANSYEKNLELFRGLIQQNYDKTFGENIIPLYAGKTMFEDVLNRANFKLPPFIESTSDKGFKDALIWLSMLNFFDSNGEQEVYLVTNDKGFRDNTEYLCKEFKEITGKTLTIKSNDYYKELLKAEPEAQPVEKQEKIPDLTQLRNRIENVLTNICGEEIPDYYGNIDWVRTFSLNKKADNSFVWVFFYSLKSNIMKHIFDVGVPTTEIFNRDERVEDGAIPISLSCLESVLKLYEDILKDYPEYKERFYGAVANIFNRNYREPLFKEIPEDELPF